CAARAALGRRDRPQGRGPVLLGLRPRGGDRKALSRRLPRLGGGTWGRAGDFADAGASPAVRAARPRRGPQARDLPALRRLSGQAGMDAALGHALLAESGLGREGAYPSRRLHQGHRRGAQGRVRLRATLPRALPPGPEACPTRLLDTAGADTPSTPGEGPAWHLKPSDRDSGGRERSPCRQPWSGSATDGVITRMKSSRTLNRCCIGRSWRPAKPSTGQLSLPDTSLRWTGRARMSGASSPAPSRTQRPSTRFAPRKTGIRPIRACRAPSLHLGRRMALCDHAGMTVLPAHRTEAQPLHAAAFT